MSLKEVAVLAALGSGLMEMEPLGKIQHMGGRYRSPAGSRKHTKKGTGRGCFKPAGSKNMLKRMDWGMMRVFFPKEVTATPGVNKVDGRYHRMKI
jgi:hypothetical protein